MPASDAYKTAALQPNTLLLAAAAATPHAGLYALWQRWYSWAAAEMPTADHGLLQ
jgi:hypothetical protein